MMRIHFFTVYCINHEARYSGFCWPSRHSGRKTTFAKTNVYVSCILSPSPSRPTPSTISLSLSPPPPTPSLYSIYVVYTLLK